jgi:small conductance mechanosensitive channel
MENITAKLMDYVAIYGPKLLTAVLIVVIGRIIVGIITSFVRKIMSKSSVEETLTKFVGSLIKAFLLTIVFIAALNSLGVQTTSLVAIVGAAGLAVGLALQSSLSNFSAGVMLIIFHPFKAGDFVEAGGATGLIEEVRIFNTTMKTVDNKIIIIPNGNIIGNNITNYSAEDTRRVDMVFGIGYDDDIKKAKEIFQRLLTEDNRILKEPESTVAVSELGDSSVNFVVRPWVKTEDYWDVFFDFHENVKLTFDSEGVSIPYPQQDVHMHQVAVNN